MTYESPYTTFWFEDYSFSRDTGVAEFRYSFDGERHFTERILFQMPQDTYNDLVLERCLFLAFMVVGASYYKCFPTKNAEFRRHTVTKMDAAFLNTVYHDGLGQFIFENTLSLENIVVFKGAGKNEPPLSYEGEGTLVLQSGGKDSLVLGSLLNEKVIPYTAWYLSSTQQFPKLIEHLSNGKRPRVAERHLDTEGLRDAAKSGGLNGHVPVTYIVEAYALIDAVLHNENTVLSSIGQEGQEPNAVIDGLRVQHQWAKTWEAEQLLARYVQGIISKNLRVGSPLRSYSELKIAELFVDKCWDMYAHTFSSCNLANYKQSYVNDELKWCGLCPKCANSFLLFSPFVEPYEIRSIFDGKDLFAAMELQQTYRGLMGVDGVMKPFECVGETSELRAAYHMARVRYGDAVYELSFPVPESDFDYGKNGSRQEWTSEYVS